MAAQERPFINYFIVYQLFGIVNFTKKGPVGFLLRAWLRWMDHHRNLGGEVRPTRPEAGSGDAPKRVAADLDAVLLGEEAFGFLDVGEVGQDGDLTIPDVDIDHLSRFGELFLQTQGAFRILGREDLVHHPDLLLDHLGQGHQQTTHEKCPHTFPFQVRATHIIADYREFVKSTLKVRGYGSPISGSILSAGETILLISSARSWAIFR